MLTCRRLGERVAPHRRRHVSGRLAVYVAWDQAVEVMGLLAITDWDVFRYRNKNL
jgi:hypothetical protein